MNTAAAASALYSLQAVAASNNLAVNLEWLGLDASALAGLGLQAPPPQPTPSVATLPFGARSSYLQAAASSASASPRFGGGGAGIHKPRAYRHLTSADQPSVDSPGDGGCSVAGSAHSPALSRVTGAGGGGGAGAGPGAGAGAGASRLPSPHLSASSQKSYAPCGGSGASDVLPTLQVQPVQGAGCRVQRAGCSVQRAACSVQGAGFRLGRAHDAAGAASTIRFD